MFSKNAVAKKHGYALGILGITLLPLLPAITGCNKETESTPTVSTATSNQTTKATSTAGGDKTLIAAGRAVFDANGCIRCHAVGGEGGAGGPDLTRVGADAEHTPQWIVAHIKDPKAHNPRSTMPAFAGKINDKDLLALGAYLSSLK